MYEENKQKVRRLFAEAWDQGNMSVIDEVLHPDFVHYDPNSEAGQVSGADAFKGEIEYYRRALDGLTHTVEDEVAEGDKVVIRWKASGSHQGDFFGVPASDKPVELSGIEIFRFDQSGKIVEAWSEYHLLGAMRQIGLIPVS